MNKSYSFMNLSGELSWNVNTRLAGVAANGIAKWIAVGKIVPPWTPHVNWHLFPAIRHEFSRRSDPRSGVQADAWCINIWITPTGIPRPLLSRSESESIARGKINIKIYPRPKRKRRRGGSRAAVSPWNYLNARVRKNRVETKKKKMSALRRKLFAEINHRTPRKIDYSASSSLISFLERTRDRACNYDWKIPRRAFQCIHPWGCHRVAFERPSTIINSNFVRSR